MAELEPCPFCGGEAGGNRVSHKPNCILSHYGITIIPQCFLKAWNTRTYEEQARENRERFPDMYEHKGGE